MSRRQGTVGWSSTCRQESQPDSQLRLSAWAGVRRCRRRTWGRAALRRRTGQPFEIGIQASERFNEGRHGAFDEAFAHHGQVGTERRPWSPDRGLQHRDRLPHRFA